MRGARDARGDGTRDRTTGAARGDDRDVSTRRLPVAHVHLRGVGLRWDVQSGTGYRGVSVGAGRRGDEAADPAGGRDLLSASSPGRHDVQREVRVRRRSQPAPLADVTDGFWGVAGGFPPAMTKGVAGGGGNDAGRYAHRARTRPRRDLV